MKKIKEPKETRAARILQLGGFGTRRTKMKPSGKVYDRKKKGSVKTDPFALFAGEKTLKSH